MLTCRGNFRNMVVPSLSTLLNQTDPFKYFSPSNFMLYVPIPRPPPLVEKDRWKNPKIPVPGPVVFSRRSDSQIKRLFFLRKYPAFSDGLRFFPGVQNTINNPTYFAELHRSTPAGQFIGMDTLKQLPRPFYNRRFPAIQPQELGIYYSANFLKTFSSLSSSSP